MSVSVAAKGAAAGCRVLVVEDDRTIAGNLVEFLEAHGHVVDLAHDGSSALARLSSGGFDVVVLDIGLPRVDGIEVLRRLRGTLGSSVPVLLLTARGRIEDKAEAFRAGADDYVVKPFALAEVAMRVAALHRRAAGELVENVLRCGSLTFDRRTREVRVGDTAVRLMPRSLRLLELLLRDPGRVVPREELEAALWGDDPPETDALRSQVHILRRALAAAGYDGLETVPKIGIRLRCGPGAGTG